VQQRDAGSAPQVLAVSNCSALNLGIETLVCSNAPLLKWIGGILEMERLSGLMEKSADVIVTDIDSVLGRECIALLGQKVPIVALACSAADEQIDAAVLKGLRGVVAKRAPNHLLLKAILGVHKGELWLDRMITSRILHGVTTSEVKPPSTLDPLTKRQLSIYEALVARPGASRRLIANDLHISEHTLRNHLSAIYSKLGVSGRLELLVLAQSLILQGTPETRF
jgi:two-component system nitrate/nitrite response regulator NarL